MKLEDGSLACKGCANRHDTPSKKSTLKIAGWSEEPGGDEGSASYWTEAGEGWIRPEVAGNPTDFTGRWDWWAYAYDGTQTEGSAFHKDEAKQRVEEHVHGGQMGLFEGRKTAGIPDHFRVLVLDRGEEVPIVVWSGAAPFEAMAKAMQEYADPDSIRVYIDRLQGPMGTYKIIWQDGNITEDFAGHAASSGQQSDQRGKDLRRRHSDESAGQADMDTKREDYWAQHPDEAKRHQEQNPVAAAKTATETGEVGDWAVTCPGCNRLIHPDGGPCPLCGWPDKINHTDHEDPEPGFLDYLTHGLFPSGATAAADDQEDSDVKCTCGANDYAGCFCKLSLAEWLADRKARGLDPGHLGARKVASGFVVVKRRDPNRPQDYEKVYATKPYRKVQGWVQPQWSPDAGDAYVFGKEDTAKKFAETQGGEVEPITKDGSLKVAHDSGDGETIYHCPFCGAGQAVARSDGTTECGFCKTVFTVQVQPSRAAVPQTIDGVPYDNPDMPGADPGTLPDEVETEGDETPLVGDEQGDTNGIFASKRYYLTREGVALSEDSYLAHVALAHADDREGVLREIRGRRG